ncbi:ribonuclease BN (tRNA processing enzyme) [Trueperella bonasi]|uniref:Ribonuclease BN (tRNA processing enzyme) n=1 Tax=Trueperella bonasi TaxID=312286 RepID=A0ABT9NF23_9ACTO|nr:MBL fold metallo-hydrolase [Trueperella bonasi]MDP9805949.1 ribonuclease BN (tRNA processing enzyme) [Trueperella bonasi]
MSLSVEVLGANATAPDAVGAASGYLVQGQTGVVKVDAGPGTMMAFMQAGHQLEDLRAIVLTHLHADHSIDIMTWAYRWTFPTVKPSIPLYVPRGETYQLESYDDLYGIPTLPTMKRPITGTFDIREMERDGESSFEVDGLTLTAYPARHAVPSAALRFERDGKSIVFSSDTGDCDGLRAAAQGANVFIAEATYLDPNPEAMAAHGHLTPALAGEIAKECGVKKLVLTHLSFSSDAEESAKRAEATFGSPVEVAVPGLRITA